MAFHRTSVLGCASVLALTMSACDMRDGVTGDLLDSNHEAAVINARSGPSGEAPRGTVRYGSPDNSLAPLWRLDVTCLSVTDKTAIIGFTGTLNTFITLGETYPTAGLIKVVDGGGPASGLDSFEFVSVEGAQDGPPIPGPTTCSSYPGSYPNRHGGPLHNAEHDLVVTDIAPLSSSLKKTAEAAESR